MKNILIINHHASIPKYGGGGRHHEFATRLSEQGYNVTMIASSFNQGQSKYLHEKDILVDNINENYKFISIKTQPNYKKNILRRLRNYVDFKNKVAKLELDITPDVIIASSVHPFTWIAGYKLSIKYNAKFVVEVRDLWPLSLYEDLNKFIRPFIFTYFEFLERKYYKLADSIIVTAPNADMYISQKYGIDKKKVFFLPHNINLREFDRNKKKNITKEIESILKNNFCVTYTGALSKSEGLESFIYLANRCKQSEHIKFLMIGSGTEKKHLLDISKELNLKNVHFFNKLPKEDIPSILYKSSVLFTGLIDRKAFKYGISKNKFYDYMAAGKPVLFMSNIDDSAIEKAECGYVIKDYSVENAEIHLNKLINDETLYKNMADNARDYVEKHHTVEKSTNKLIEILEK